MSSQAMNYLIHHIFLPPELPHGDDSKPEYEIILLDTVIEALRKFKSLIADDQYYILDSILAMVSAMRTMLDSSSSQSGLVEGKLEVDLKKLCEQGE